MPSARTDIFVIGGGPAGLAAAIAARLQGFDVTVIDAACPPIDKACGEGILPAGVGALHQLGVSIAGGDVFRLRGIRFVGRGAAVQAVFGHGYGLAVRRKRLHDLLVARASDLGVHLRWGERFGGLSACPPCRWIVGADGQNSRVRRDAGLDAARRESFRYGFRRHYRLAPWTDFVEVHWGSHCQLYVTPVSAGEVGVALLTRDSHLRLDAALPQFPAVHKHLQSAEPSSLDRGAVTFSRRLRRVSDGRTALIGDAAGSVDAITGDGLSLAFHHAIALSEAFFTADLGFYESAHKRLSRRPALMSALLLSLDRFPTLCRGVLKTLAAEPPIFAKLLTMHAETPS